MYGGETEHPIGKYGPVTWRAVGLAVALHLALFVFFWGMGKLIFRTPEVIIPIDLTIVPPWAEQTDDPDPDPNPPPKDVPKPKTPPPAPEQTKVVEQKPVEAVEQIKEKPKPKKEKPKPEDLRKKATFVKTPVQPPKPVDLRDKAKKIEPPPEMKRIGKGTAHEKPLSQDEIMRRLMEGYKFGSKNNIAKDEVTRCYSLVSQAIRREWDKESFNWHPGLQSLQIELQLGPGGTVRSFRIVSGSGDSGVDRTARSALTRLKFIAGLSSMFIQQFSVLPVAMEPVGAR